MWTETFDKIFIMNTAKILFKLTSRSRPSWMFRALDSIINNLYDKENYCIVCTFDSDDITTNNMEVIGKLQGYKNLTYHFGNSKTKIEAINNDIDKFPDDWNILVNVSDDQIFTSMFFDRTIRQAMEQYFPDTDGVTHFPDQNTKAALITLSILGRKYFERIGNLIYQPVYISLYCDQEFGDVARILNKYIYIDIPIYKHLHPAWGLANMDAQYQKTESFYKRDGEVYKARKAINFGLDLSK